MRFAVQPSRFPSSLLSFWWLHSAAQALRSHQPGQCLCSSPTVQHRGAHGQKSTWENPVLKAGISRGQCDVSSAGNVAEVCMQEMNVLRGRCSVGSHHSHRAWW